MKTDVLSENKGDPAAASLDTHASNYWGPREPAQMPWRARPCPKGLAGGHGGQGVRVTGMLSMPRH